MPFIPDVFYKRFEPDTIFVRDKQGRCRAFRIRGGNAYPSGSTVTSAGPTYGRFDWQNRRRFTASVRSSSVLESAFLNTPEAQIRKTDWFNLPRSRSVSRRTGNQGMKHAMINLTGANRSALDYILWINDRSLSHAGWEWCHLQAHSMGGRDEHQNVVAARRGNNSEQLIIENALQMYRQENIFEMRVSAALFNNNNGKYAGNIIRYEIRSRANSNRLIHHLDCLGAPNPSGIHHGAMHQGICRWANIKLTQLSRDLYGNTITAEEKRAVRRYLNDH
ncbi:MAG: hypothetical protein V4660_06220 [Pseudomonadota bacterium]